MTDYQTMFRETAGIAEAALDTAARYHLIAIRVAEELRSERADEAWYQEHHERIAAWPDLYQEHKAKLALLERLAAE